MRKYWVIAVIMILFLAGMRLVQMVQAVPTEFVPVLLVDGYEDVTEDSVLKAYESILDEEGIAHRSANLMKLMELEPEEALKAYPALVFAEGATQRYPRTVMPWLTQYAQMGGGLLFVYDSGTKRLDGAYYPMGIWRDLTGVEYFSYEDYRGECVTRGLLHFPTLDQAEIMEWPHGKRDDEGYVVGYHYGRLRYPMSMAAVVGDNVEVLLEGVTDEGDTVPVVTRRKLGEGFVSYANLPAGALKGDADDLIARSILRMFLRGTLGTIHVASTPEGLGGLVINWHVDSAIEWENLPKAFDSWLIEGLDYSIHITAGDFCDEPGDGYGFDACGAGRILTKRLMKCGTLGSHGGWGHNWYAAHLDPLDIGDFTWDDMKRFIRMNNECVSEVTGYPVREYSAPNGIHPQPENTQFLEKEGVVAYYYAGDGGSVPTRAFLHGKMMSNRVVAFPVMPRRIHASLEEIRRANVPEADVEAWMEDLADFAASTHTVRLWYSHPYDVPHYPGATGTFLRYVKDLRDQGKLTVMPMSTYADYLLRVVGVTQRYQWQDDGSLHLELAHPNGLKGICLRFPEDRYELIQPEDVTVSQQQDDRIFCINEETNHVDVVFTTH